jgi:curli biogenesis system outer membrane secretion channel CsgG
MQYADNRIDSIRNMSDEEAIQQSTTLFGYLQTRLLGSKEANLDYATKDWNDTLRAIILQRKIRIFDGHLFSERYYSGILYAFEEKIATNPLVAGKLQEAVIKLNQGEKASLTRSYEQKSYEDFVSRYETQYAPEREYLIAHGLSTPDPSLLPMYTVAKEIVNYRLSEAAYNQALESISKEKYFNALTQLALALKYTSNFKNAAELIAQVNQKLMLGIGLQGIEDNFNCGGVGATVSSRLLKPTNDYRAFVEITDRSNLGDVIGEQALWGTGAVQNSEELQYGQIVGAKWLVVGKVDACNVEESRVPIHSIPAYKIVEHTQFVSATGTRYNESTGVEEVYSCTVPVTRYSATPANVQIFSGVKRINTIMTLKIIDVETGRYLLSRQFQEKKEDKISYADCGGCDISRLSTTIPSDSDPGECQGFLVGLFSGIVEALFSGLDPPVDASRFLDRRVFANTFDMQKSIASRLSQKAGAELSGAINSHFQKFK